MGVIALVVVSSAVSAAAEEAVFAPVAEVFERRCVECHGAEERKGGLSLETREAIVAGGDSGSAIELGKSDGHLLLDMVIGERPEMPKGKPPLKAEEIAAIRAWIGAGAPWPAGKKLEDRSLADSNWWSLQPLARPAIPEISVNDQEWSRNAIDAFVVAAIREKGFEPSPLADRRTLIRRLSFDLLGLPPLPEEVEQFVNDPDPHAYERLVDRMLASPRYGERWARHWLDVVHFGETHGYDKDQPRPNAWPYRDYLIRALNEDKPYGQFVEEQIAGDVLYPDTVDGIEALGFLAAGPWDLIGHVEVPESKIDGKIARHLDRDDVVCNVIGTFNSLTVGCAQCHNHKFDPIKQVDYYRLQAVFAAIDRADRKYHANPTEFARYAALERQQRELTLEKQQLDEELRAKGGEELASLEKEIESARKATPGDLRPEYGYHSQLMPTADEEKWVQVDLGEPREIASVRYVGCFDNFNGIGAGFGFPPRYKIEAADDPSFKTDVKTLADHTRHDVANPGTAPQVVAFTSLKARYVRFTATKLAHRQNDYMFALAEMQVLDPAGKNLAEGAGVTSLDSIEAPPRWWKVNLVDGIFPRDNQGGAGAEKLETLTKQRSELVGKLMAGEFGARVEANRAALAKVSVEWKKVAPPNIVYAGTVHHGTGNFVGTGTSGGRPRPIFLLHRGDVKNPKDEVGPGTLSCIPSMPGEFELPPNHSEGDRRAALAKWISDRRNPLTWRSIVNRVWQYHFGRGLVDTPNDFGRMGQLPSHPELLDWLAAEFVEGGQSLKSLHRLIVLSSTYQQQSEPDEKILARAETDPRSFDSGNVYLWRMNRRKLEAEAVRDAVLLVSGKLNLKMGGPSFQDFIIDQPTHSPHYEYHLHDPADPKSHRRSIYRFIVRSQPQPFMATLDCADPSMRVDKRNESLSPLQALTLLNNGFMVTMSEATAERIAAKTADAGLQVDELFALALARRPSVAERELFTEFIRSHGLANACRAVMNSNEFVFVD